MDSTVRLLAACTSWEQNMENSTRVLHAVSDMTSWGNLPAKAEMHHMAPLLYQNLKNCGAVLPQEILPPLRALFLRHRLINRVRIRVLEEVLAGAQAVGVFPIVLKGAALSQTIYPDPALRPMNDIDLLVSDAELAPMQKVLFDQGFCSDANTKKYANHRHLPPFSKEIDGFNICFEIHHDLYINEHRRCWGKTSDLICPPLDFITTQVGLTARTLGHEDTIVQLCRHMTLDDCGFQPFRMIWAADINGFLAKYGTELDWALLNAKYPEVLNILSHLEMLIPLPPDLSKNVTLPVIPRPGGIGESYMGWPNTAFYSRKKIGVLKFIRQTLFPSTWWLGMSYGKSTNEKIHRCWFRHLNSLVTHASRQLKNRFTR